LGRWLKSGATYLLYAFLRQSDEDAGRPGESNIVQLFSPDFALRDVARGTEGDRISAWFTFERTQA
jgi:hypothetical protein